MLTEFNESQRIELFAAARESERLRAHFELHDSHNDKVQRIVIAMLNGTVVEPHYHVRNDQWELIICLEGEVEFLKFDNSGKCIESTILAAGAPVAFMHVPQGVIHSINCVSREALIMEVKEGPYLKDCPPIFPFRELN